MTEQSTKVDIPARSPRRVRLDIDEAKADKLKKVAAAKGYTQSQLVEIFIDSLEDPVDSP